MYNVYTLKQLLEIRDSLSILEKYGLGDDNLKKEILQEIEYRIKKQIINTAC